MRTAEIEIDGKSYLLCFSTRVVRACTDRYGDMSRIGEALSNEDRAKAMDEAVWLLSQMMDAGARYARLNDLDARKPLTEEELYDLSDIGDFFRMRGKIMETITSGRETHVEVSPPKNAEATQGGA